MTDQLVSQIQKIEEIAPQKIIAQQDKFIFMEKKKNEFLVEAGRVNRNFYFMLEGYARTFHQNDGEETTSEIYGKGDFAASMYCVLTQKPAYDSIQCITDCQICTISEEDFTSLYATDSQWMLLGMKALKLIQIKKEKRIANLLTLNATERYQLLMDEHPDYLQHIPIRILSSYLGIKPESLSRIRGQISAF